MQTRTTQALAALALLAVRPAAQELTFAPAEGVQMTRTFEYTSEAVLDDFSVQLDGEDLTAMLGEFSFEMEATQTYVVTDEVVEAEDGRIARLVRTFDELGGESEVLVESTMGSETIETTASSELEGETVVFTWDEDEEDWSVSAGEDSDIDSDLLEGLEFDMDLAGFLPDDEVESGDSWEVELLGLAGVSFPGGNLGLMPDEGMEDMEGFDPAALTEMMEEYQERALEMLDDWVDGSVRATFAGSHEADGVQLGGIDIELDLAVEAELSELVQDALDEIFSQLDMPMEVDFSVDLLQVDADTEGDGKLTWDLDASHGHSLVLAIEYEFDLEMEMSVDAAGESHEIAAQVAGSGVMKTEVTVE